MAMTWTKDQQKVIDSRNKNLLVSAAAGSGKTAVLVERIVAMITEKENPVDLDRLLVMTFTNAAAAQMRERIGQAIQEKLQENPSDARLQVQAAFVPHAQIQTIDSFCLFLIRNHYASLDIDPSFRVGDEGELRLLETDVMAELLEEHYEAGTEGFERFVETYGGGKTDKGIEEVISQVYHFSTSHPWPKQWLAQCRQEFGEEGASHFEESPWVKFLLWDVRGQMEEFAAQLSQVIAVCQESDGPECYLPVIREDREMVLQIGAASSFQELQNRLEDASFSRLPAARSKEIQKDKKEFATSIRNRVKKGVQKCREQYGAQTIEEIQEGIRGCAPAVEMLLDLAEEFTDRYQQAKKERNIVDFGDLEHYALEILYEEGKPSRTADELSRHYAEILVDEYQDSNSVQEALIYALSKERFGHPNVFMVGDVKQSIYRFRQARPELFLEKYKTYGKEEGNCQKIELQKNFRSRSQVLESVNQVFAQIMTERLGGIQYTEDTALYPGAAFPEVEETGTGYQTELLAVDTGSRELSSLDEETRDFTSRELEVKLAVQEIRRLTDRETGLMVWDKEEGGYRRARYGDIVILLRSLSGWAETFVNGLMNEGIPAYAQSQAGYFDTTEIETILSLLAVIDNPIQDIPLAAVMRSPIIGMSDEELAWMMARFKKEPKKGQDRGIYGAWRLWMADKQAEEEGAGEGSSQIEKEGDREKGSRTEGEESSQTKNRKTSRKKKAEKPEVPEGWAGIREKLEKLERLVARFRYLAGIFPIHQLLEQIYRETGYYAYVSAMPAGETRQANLELLVEKAAAYESTSYQGLFHFIRYVERLKKVETDFGEAAVAGSKERTVRIMSIHKSKGLEFPIVILAGMGKKFNRQDVYGRLLIDADYGIGADYMDLERRLKSVTLKKQVLRRRLDLENMGEELRVLYVAMTRAKEKLIMTASDLYLENKLEKWGIRTDENGVMLPGAGGFGLKPSCAHSGRTTNNESLQGALGIPELMPPNRRRDVHSKNRGDKLPFTLLSGAGSYLDWMFMALPGASGSIRFRQYPAAAFIGREVLRQMEKQTSKEQLLFQTEEGKLDPVYQNQLKEILHYRYPHQADVGLYAMMSVSELKRRSQEEEQETAVALFPEQETKDQPDWPEEPAALSNAPAALPDAPAALPEEPAALSNAPAALPDAKIKKGGGAARGTAYHRALELLSGGECQSVRDVAEKLDELIRLGRFSQESRKLVNAGVLWKFFQSSLGKKLKEAEREGRLHKEQQFMIGIPAKEMGLADSDELVLVQGMIDAYIEDDDGLVLIDYKTDYVEHGEELLARYQVQMKYYVRALEQVTGKKVKEAVIYSLRLQEEVRSQQKSL